MPHRIHKHVYARRAPVKKEPIDYAVRFFMVATPLFELPQAYAIYANQSSANVSIITWGFFMLSSVVWLAYGVRKKIFPLMVANSLYLLVEAAIVVGYFMYL